MLGNTKSFYAFQIFGGLETGLAMPIFVLFFQSKGLGLAEFMVLMSIFNLSVFLFEIPSGAFADLAGRKLSLILGAIAMAISTFGIIALDSPLLLIAFFVIWGMGEALISGADSALLYDSLENRETFARIFGRANTGRLSATVIGTIVCGTIIDWIGLVAPIWGAFWASLICIGIAFTFHENTRSQHARKSIRAQISDTVSVFSKNSHLLIITLLGVVFHRACGLIERPLSQPLLLQNSFSESAIGYAHSGFFLLAALGSFWVFHLVKHGDMWAFGSTGILMGLSLAILSYGHGYFIVCALAGVFLVRGITFPTIQHSLNQHIPSDQRATGLSIAKMGSNLSGVILGPMVGFVADQYSVVTGAQVLLWLFVTSLIGLLWNFRKR